MKVTRKINGMSLVQVAVQHQFQMNMLAKVKVSQAVTVWEVGIDRHPGHHLDPSLIGDPDHTVREDVNQEMTVADPDIDETLVTGGIVIGQGHMVRPRLVTGTTAADQNLGGRNNISMYHTKTVTVRGRKMQQIKF